MHNVTLRDLLRRQGKGTQRKNLLLLLQKKVEKKKKKDDKESRIK
jgi:hypothetical protein